MPEGPEIRRAVDKISKKLVGKKIESINFYYHKLEKYNNIIKNPMINSISTRGKAILIRFDNGLTMYSHNQLYGKWTVNFKKTKINTNRSLRVEFLTNNYAIRLWSATDIEIIDTEKEEDHPYIRKLGPDILNKTLTINTILNRLKSNKFNNRSSSSLMLDQSFLSGIGNYLRSEILHQSKVNPFSKPKEMSDEKLLKWAENIKKISNLAYTTGGITVSNSTMLSGKERGEKRKSYRHSAFCRNGLPCHYCGIKIIRIRIGSRRLDYCPNCQKKDT
tara:strand:- start:715 stop:1542 length:828 start_codon:yes stop_codon:yes gene_type:complete